MSQFQFQLLLFMSAKVSQTFKKMMIQQLQMETTVLLEQPWRHCKRYFWRPIFVLPLSHDMWQGTYEMWHMTVLILFFGTFCPVSVLLSAHNERVSGPQMRYFYIIFLKNIIKAYFFFYQYSLRGSFVYWSWSSHPEVQFHLIKIMFSKKTMFGNLFGRTKHTYL